MAGTGGTHANDASGTLRISQGDDSFGERRSKVIGTWRGSTLVTVSPDGRSAGPVVETNRDEPGATLLTSAETASAARRVG